MSNLLHSVLTNRLANASLQEGQGQGDSNGQSGRHDEDWESVDQQVSYTSDDELVSVMSLPGTVPGTPATISRPSSPGGTRAKAELQKKKSKSGLSTPTTKSKTDPLRAFPSDISLRIFLTLSVPDLLSCSLVSKRWRRSATLNYCWYRLCQLSGFESDAQFHPTASSGAGAESGGGLGAKWTRRASKTDWKASYAQQQRVAAREAERAMSLPGSGTSTPSRSQRLANAGIITPREANEAQWAAETDEGYTKNEMRDYYKTLGTKGGKVKGKSGKGGPKAGSRDDGGLWE